jgi:hypothetical protein
MLLDFSNGLFGFFFAEVIRQGERCLRPTLQRLHKIT